MVLAELGSKVAIALRKMTSATVIGTRRRRLASSLLSSPHLPRLRSPSELRARLVCFYSVAQTRR